MADTTETVFEQNVRKELTEIIQQNEEIKRKEVAQIG